MVSINLGAYLVPDLEFEHGDKVYSAPTPSRKAGLQMSAIVALGSATYTAADKICPVCGRSGEVEFDPELKPLLDEVKDQPLGILTLGQETFDAMIRDGVSEAHQDQYALYALYYWTMGKDNADQHFEARYSRPEEDPAPKA